jgi:hypothetical protein
MIELSATAAVAAASGVAVAVGAALEQAVNKMLRRIRVINNLDFMSFYLREFPYPNHTSFEPKSPRQ